MKKRNYKKILFWWSIVWLAYSLLTACITFVLGSWEYGAYQSVFALIWTAIAIKNADY